MLERATFSRTANLPSLLPPAEKVAFQEV